MKKMLFFVLISSLWLMPVACAAQSTGLDDSTTYFDFADKRSDKKQVDQAKIGKKIVIGTIICLLAVVGGAGLLIGIRMGKKSSSDSAGKTKSDKDKNKKNEEKKKSQDSTDSAQDKKLKITPVPKKADEQPTSDAVDQQKETKADGVMTEELKKEAIREADKVVAKLQAVKEHVASDTEGFEEYAKIFLIRSSYLENEKKGFDKNLSDMVSKQTGEIKQLVADKEAKLLPRAVNHLLANLLQPFEHLYDPKNSDTWKALNVFGDEYWDLLTDIYRKSAMRIPPAFVHWLMTQDKETTQALKNNKSDEVELIKSMIAQFTPEDDQKMRNYFAASPYPAMLKIYEDLSKKGA